MGEGEAYDGSRPALRSSPACWTSIEAEEWQADGVDSITVENSPNPALPHSSLVEAEEEHDDNNSILQDDAVSTTSLTLILLEYRELYSRKCHNYPGAAIRYGLLCNE